MVSQFPQKDIEASIQEKRNSLSTDRLDMSFGEVMSLYTNYELIIDPEFQRLFRWSDEQKTRFIESILLGIPIPPIFVAENEKGQWELVDGLQRVSTILSFFGILRKKDTNLDDEKNHWSLLKGDLVEDLENFTANSLPQKLSLSLKRAVCRIEIIRWNSKVDMRYELFNRLNTGGSILTDQEIRNCIFRGKSVHFNNYLKKLSGNMKFINLIQPTEKQESELYLEELVLRFTSLFDNESGVKKNISEHMTEFMKNSVENSEFDFNKYETLLLRVVDVLSKIGPDVFKGKNGGFSASIYDVVTIGIAKYIDRYEKAEISVINDKIRELYHDSEFISAMGTASNNKARINKRIEIAERLFNIN
ncbi:DUF262 domain-containing protein [Herpetosiphon sp. NSE202]|uniref:DUF262 domain-containing protein n=1 Tax=Herpetosiphon sp. NSE202 TaxID=3351349 RepID=UPI003629C450